MEPFRRIQGQTFKFKNEAEKMKKTLILAGLIVTIPGALMARWGINCGYDYMQGRNGSFGPGYFFNGGSFMFLITLIVTAFLIYFTYTYFKNKKVMDINNGNPFDILKLRYAKGEISKKEFDETKSQLG